MNSASQRVHGGSADGALGDQVLGRDIRALRKVRRLTLSELSRRIGRSVGYLSQAERGISSLSIADLKELAAALDVPVGWFLAQPAIDPAERGYVARAGERRRLGTSEEGLIEELLSPDLGGLFELVSSEFAPGARSKGVIRRGVEEAGYIIEGCFEIVIGKRKFVLRAGDSFRFRDEDLSWYNPGPTITRVLWVVAPPVY